ncbi:MAG: hypothetical protein ACAH83_19145 [Alphaproteobacteria bacterium]
MMTLDEFREHVDIYSADLSRWPQDKLKTALQMVKENTAAKEYFDAALALDDKLRAYAPTAPSMAALEDRILKGIAASRQPVLKPVQEDVHIRSAWIFAPGGGLLAAAILGFIIGLSPPSAGGGDTLVDPVYYAQDQIIGGDTDDDDDMGEVF